MKFLPALAALLISMLLPATSASAEDSPTIEISHHQLIPAELSVKVGERVIFLNRVDMLGRHGGKADDGSFASPQLEKGQKWRHGFEGMASKAWLRKGRKDPQSYSARCLRIAAAIFSPSIPSRYIDRSLPSGATRYVKAEWFIE